jgi:hypothetical protein
MGKEKMKTLILRPAKTENKLLLARAKGSLAATLFLLPTSDKISGHGRGVKLWG